MKIENKLKEILLSKKKNKSLIAEMKNIIGQLEKQKTYINKEYLANLVLANNEYDQVRKKLLIVGKAMQEYPATIKLKNKLYDRTTEDRTYKLLEKQHKLLDQQKSILLEKHPTLRIQRKVAIRRINNIWNILYPNQKHTKTEYTRVCEQNDIGLFLWNNQFDNRRKKFIKPKHSSYLNGKNTPSDSDVLFDIDATRTWNMIVESRQ